MEEIQSIKKREENKLEEASKKEQIYADHKLNMELLSCIHCKTSSKYY